MRCSLCFLAHCLNLTAVGEIHRLELVSLLSNTHCLNLTPVGEIQPSEPLTLFFNTHCPNLTPVGESKTGLGVTDDVFVLNTALWTLKKQSTRFDPSTFKNYTSDPATCERFCALNYT